MAVIKYDELFDFPGYQKAIKDLEGANKEFGQTVNAINDRISKQYKDIAGDLKAYSDILKNFQINQKGAADTIIKTGEAALKAKEKMAEQKKIIAELVGVQDLSTKSVNELKIAYKALEAEYNAIKGKEESDIQRKKELSTQAKLVKQNIIEQSSALKVSKTVLDAAENSYQALQKEMTEIGKQLKAMPNAFNTLTGQLNKNNKEAVLLAKRYSEINSSLKAADAQLGNFQRNVGNYSSAFKGFSGVFKSSISDILSVVGLVSVGSFLKDSVDEFLEADKKLRILKNTLNNVGLPEAFGRIETKVRDLQKQFSYLDDDDIIEVFNNLIRYGKLTENQMNELLPVIIDFAAATGQDLASATSTIIKALEGNGRALKEFGIDMKDAKSVTEGFSLIMNDLAPRVNGVGKAFGESAAGGIAKSKQQFKELKEEIGTGLLPVLVSLLSLINNAINGFKLLGNAIVNEFQEGTGNATLILSRLSNEQSKLEIEQIVKVQTSILDERIELFKKIQSQGKLAGKTEKDVRDEFAQNLKDQISTYEKIISERSRSVNILSKAQRDDLVSAAVTLEALKKTLQQTTQTDGNIILGSGDPNKTDKKTGGKSAEEIERERIKKTQEQLESIANKRIALFELAKETEIIGEQELASQKLEIIRNYVSASIELERSKKSGEPDLKLIEDLTKRRIDAEKEYQQFLNKTEKENLEKRKKAIEDEAALRVEGLEGEKELVLSSKKLTDNQRKALELQYQNEIDKILIDSLERRIALETDAEKRKDLELKKIQLERGIDTRNRKFEEEAINDKYNTEIKAARNAFDIIRAGRDTSFKEELAFLERLKAIKIKYAKDTAEEELAIAELKAERERELREQINETIFLSLNAGLEIAQNLINGSFEQNIANLEAQKKKELDQAGNNAQARALIEENYNKKIAEQKNKQARSEKNFALFRVAIDTAQAVSKTIAEWGMPFAIPFIALAVIQGALQAAVIASRPLPKYKAGRKGGKAEYAIVDEEAPELIIDRHGKLREIGTDKERVTYLHEGDSVINARETEKILKMTAITNEVSLHSKLTHSIKDGKEVQMIYVMSKSMPDKNIEYAFEKAVKKIPVHQTIFDEKGIRERDKTVSGTTTYLQTLTKN